jgi:hypothetical protein
MYGADWHYLSVLSVKDRATSGRCEAAQDLVALCGPVALHEISSSLEYLSIHVSWKYLTEALS